MTQDKDYSIHKLILGTNTSDNENNFLLIAKVRLPTESPSEQADNNNVKIQNIGGISLSQGE